MTEEEYNYHKEIISKLDDLFNKPTCIRRLVKCLAINPRIKKGISVIGYGVNKSLVNCKTCYRERNSIVSGTQNELCFAIHAEQDLVCKCGNNLSGSHVYVTHRPCITCLKLLIACGVKKIYYLNSYPAHQKFYDDLIKSNDITVEQIAK